MTEDEQRAFGDLEALLTTMVAQQEAKVLALARRLKPGVTAEDVRNPHDFPELRDEDFNYEDGTLAGLQYALAALRARRRERELAGGTNPRVPS